MLSWFGNFKTWQKLALCFVIMIGCLGLVVVRAKTVIDGIRGDMEYALNARSLRNNANRARLSILQIILRNYIASSVSSAEVRAGDAEDITEIKDATKDTYQRLEKLEKYFQGDKTAEDLIKEIRDTTKAYADTRDNEQIPAIQAHQMETARAVAVGINSRRFAKIRLLAAQLAEHAAGVAGERAEAAVQLFYIVGGGCFVMALFLLWALSSLIATPLELLTKAARRLAVGDTQLVLPHYRGNDEVGALTRSFSEMADSWRAISATAKKVAEGDLTVALEPRSQQDTFVEAFNTLVQNVAQITNQFKEAVQVLSAAASEILVSVNESAVGATQTATAANETSAIVEEVRQTSHVASQKAKQVSDSANKTAQITAAGRKATEDIIEGMNRIREQVDLIAEAMVRLSEKSQSISGIISTVDDLAKQSNLLAVNASIEAARAGELGRGFGVVAQEVKNMAEQSKHSTAQVRAIIAEIQQATNAAAMATELGGKAVDAALQQSGRAGESIAVLAGSVLESAQAAAQIAVSNQQQLAGVDQVAVAMTSIRDACEEHLVAVKHVETAANRLNEIGRKLKALVDRYDSWRGLEAQAALQAALDSDSHMTDATRT